MEIYLKKQELLKKNNAFFILMNDDESNFKKHRIPVKDKSFNTPSQNNSGTLIINTLLKK